MFRESTNLSRKFSCGTSSYDKVVQECLNANEDNNRERLKESLNFKDESNNTILHHLVHACPPTNIILRIIQLSPDIVRVTNDGGSLPLHEACRGRASPDVVKMILDAYPKCAEVKDQDGCLPLHYACLKYSSFYVIRILLEAYPKAVNVREKGGRKPVEITDCNGMLLLHHACYNGISNDTLQAIVDAYPEGCNIKDNQNRQPWQLLQFNGAAARCDEGGSFPLHHACRKGASLHVLKLLLDAYPECVDKTNIDGKTPSQLLGESGVAAKAVTEDDGKLPLHCACSEFYNSGSVDHLEKFVRLIIDAYPRGKYTLDRSYMTPLHYACSYANSREALHCLVTLLVEDNQEPSINVIDIHGRTPLCILMQRTDPKTLDISKKSCSQVVQFIVESNVVEYLVNMGADIDLMKKESPLHFIENLSNGQYENVPQRLQLYFQLKPKPNTEFYCFLQQLPLNVRKEAVLNDYVQERVKEVVRQKLPTCILILDFDFIVSVIVCFGIAVSRYNEYLFQDPSSCEKVNCVYENFHAFPAMALGGGLYFLAREVMQILAVASIGYCKIWWSDPWNYVDVVCIVNLLVWPTLMITGIVNRESDASRKEAFRSLSSLASGTLFLLVFSFLKRILCDFAVFVRGLIAVSKKLLSFFLALVIIITAFALMFFIMFRGSTTCLDFCSFESSWFEIYDMVLGNYGPEDIFSIENLSDTKKYFLLALYILLGITVIIVLLNVLIAVVVDSYSDIKKKEAEEMLWSSRLNFVAEVEVISYLFQQLCTLLPGWSSFLAKPFADKTFSIAWVSVAKVFEDKRTDDENGNRVGSKFMFYLIPRLIVIVFILIWFTLGAVTAGLLWPPQVRIWLWYRSDIKKLTNEECLWKASIDDINNRIATNQETMERKIESMVTEIRTELMKVKQKNTLDNDRISEIINQNEKIVEMMNHHNDLMVDMMKQTIIPPLSAGSCSKK